MRVTGFSITSRAPVRHIMLITMPKGMASHRCILRNVFIAFCVSLVCHKFTDGIYLRYVRAECLGGKDNVG